MPIDYEAEYNNRARVPEHPQIFERWQRDGAAYLSQAKAEGRTVFLSSHILSEVEKTCDRVAIIREGRLARVDQTGALRDLAHHTVELVFTDHVPVDAFRSIPGVSDVVAEDHLLRMRVAGNISAVVQAAARYELTDFVSREPSLEETFLAEYAWSTEGCGEPCVNAALRLDELLTLGADVFERSVPEDQQNPEPPARSEEEEKAYKKAKKAERKEMDKLAKEVARRNRPGSRSDAPRRAGTGRRHHRLGHLRRPSIPGRDL